MPGDMNLFAISCQPAKKEEQPWNQHVLAPTAGAALDRALELQAYKIGDALIVVQIALDRELEQKGQTN